jgi:hypothetical protein
MSGLGELFDEAEGRAAVAAGGARLGGEELGAVHSRVRRAHARRSALRASLVAVAAVVVGAGVAWGVSAYRAVDPVATPSPSVTPSSSVTPSPSPSPSDTGFAWPGFSGEVTVDPHLPDAGSITPEVWAGTGPGWVLVSYREAWGDAPTVGPQVIYLVSPAGERYELVNVPGDTVSVLAWEAGSATAPVSVQPYGDAPYLGMLDLVTGEVTSMDGYAPYLWSIAFLDADGAPIWHGNDATSAWVSMSADGQQSEYAWPEVTVSAPEVAYNAFDFEGRDCGNNAPFDDESSIVTCWDNRYTVGDSGIDAADAHRVVARVWPLDGRVETLHESTYAEPGAQQPSRAGDFVVASTGATGLDGCPSSYSILAGGEAAPVPGWDPALHPNPTIFTPFGTAGNVLTWGVTSGCSGDVSPVVVVMSDLAGGTSAVLVPYPEGRPAGEEPVYSVQGVAVAR